MSLNGTVWAPIGPSPMKENGGRDNGLVTAIAVNPNNTNVLYLGTAQGGVWRSKDGGNTWTPLFDRQRSLGIGEPAGIAIDPNNADVVYVGASGRVGAIEPGTISQPSAGLFKSTDGGASWIAMGSGYPAGNTGNAIQFVRKAVNVIIVDPDPASAVIYLADQNGVFTSTDGGLNWTAATGIAGDTRSLALDLSTPSNARILFAGVAGQGVFKSTDGGATFTQVLSGTTPAVAAALGGGGFVRVVVALAPPASPPDLKGVQVIYVTMSAGYGAPNDPVGVFISKDQGQTWTRQNASGVSGTTYGGYALDMAVDPASPGDGSNDVIYLGCLNQFKSTDSGATFSGLSVGHADTHTWTLVSGSGGANTTVYCGNDGGIDVSTDNGATWKPLNSGGLQTGLFYNITVKPDATASVTAGALQDNRIETTAGVAAPEWNATTGGDGWDVAYDGSSPPVLYATSGGPATVIQASTDDGVSWPTNVTPPWTSADTGGFILTPLAADPSAAGILYASGLQNLWQRQSGGTWRKIFAPGTTGNVDVAATNGNHVVIAAGSQVFVSTNALAATVGLPSGVTFANITRNLPGRNVARAVFDPLDPNTIYAVLTGFDFGSGQNVFRTTVGATSWTNISPPVDVPCGAITIDGTTTPSTLYVGTDLGVIRSVDGGATWSVLDDIHFPHVPVSDLDFNAQAGVLRAGTYGRGVFEFTKPTGPSIDVSLQNGLAFGTVCSGPSFLTLTVYNVGGADLVITSVQRLVGSADFTVLPTPATPVSISPGEEITFTVVFIPTAGGALETATIRIISNDPTAPFVDVSATGRQGMPAAVTAIANSGHFGDVCLGSFVDEELTINNSGACPLVISGITAGPDFLAPSVRSYPLRVGPGDSIDVPIRFQPSSYGPKAATITVFSNDPAAPATVAVSGVVPAPKANLLIANRGNFGGACVGSFVDESLIVTNSGKCTLTVTGITTTGDFLAPQVLSYPITIGPGDALPVPIRFQPLSFGAKTGTITVASDDPASPITIQVSGDAPPGKLAITGSTSFGGVTAGCCADRTLSICNVGDCHLDVKSVHFRRTSRHWRFLHNPFPAKLPPGSCLSVVLQYHATERCARICELVIESDDPKRPEKFVEVTAYTVWDCCCCDEDEDRHRRNRKKHHHEHCCHQGYPCACEDDEEDEDDDERRDR
ncbi:MAG: choice-of-anchor D domain-containing protein [Solirubrobacterales bacterium]|nr:choice-of-anchor D domain-containing protein [Solirubrobacterales bacterium]